MIRTWTYVRVINQPHVSWMVSGSVQIRLRQTDFCDLLLKAADVTLDLVVKEAVAWSRINFNHFKEGQDSGSPSHLILYI